MTTICAYRDSLGNIWMAADSRVIVGERVAHTDHCKICVLETSTKKPLVVGVAGDVDTMNILKRIELPQERMNETAVAYLRDRFLGAWKKAAAELGLVGRNSHGIEFTNACLLISYLGQICTFGEYGTVLVHPHYEAIGSGSHFALGAMSVMDELQDCGGLTAVYLAMKAAAKFDPYTSFPMYFYDPDLGEIVKLSEDKKKI